MIILDGIPAGKTTFQEYARQLNPVVDAVGGGALQLTLDNARDTYLRKISECVRLIQFVMPPATIDRIFRTTQYRSIFDSSLTNGGALKEAVELELARCHRDLVALKQVVDDQVIYWSRTGNLLVLDTNIYMHYPPDERPDGFDITTADFAHLASTVGDHFTLVLPLVVLDELDGLKDRGDGKQRSRARAIIKTIQQHLGQPGRTGKLQSRHPTPNGDLSSQVDLAVVLDPLHHVRLTRNDDEIVDRVQLLQSATGERVITLSYDAGFHARTHSAGLDCRKPKAPTPSVQKMPAG